jgi:hypothetical protein
MKHFISAIAAISAFAVSLSGSVNETNTTPEYVKKFTMMNEITCPYPYYTSFTCEHYLVLGESMVFNDGYDGDSISNTTHGGRYGYTRRG